MFADGIRMAGLDLLSRMRIREGMQLCVEQIEPNRWGEQGRIRRCLASLKRYGGNARSLLPKLREARRLIEKRRWDQKKKRSFLDAFDDVIKTIENDKNPPKLRSAKDVIRGAKQPIPRFRFWGQSIMSPRRLSSVPVTGERPGKSFRKK
jgi:hypothetical protein